MNRTGLALSAVLAAVGATQLLFPTEVAALYTLDSSVALFALSAAVLSYGVWFGPLKFLLVSRTLRLLGSIISVAALASISSPTLWGLRESFVPIVDIFLVLETGIMLQLIGLEKKQQNVPSPLGYFSSASQLFQRRLNRGHSAPPIARYFSR